MRLRNKLLLAAITAALLTPAANAGWFRECRERRQEARASRQCQSTRTVGYAPCRSAPPAPVAWVVQPPATVSHAVVYPAGAVTAPAVADQAGRIAPPAMPVPTAPAPLFTAPAYLGRPVSRSCTGNRCGG